MTLPFHVHSNVHKGGNGAVDPVGEPVQLHVDRYFSYESIQSTEEKLSVHVAAQQRFPEFRGYETELMACAYRPDRHLGSACFLHAWRIRRTYPIWPLSTPPGGYGIIVFLPPMTLLTPFTFEGYRGGLYAVPGALEARGVVFHLTRGTLRTLRNFSATFAPWSVDDPDLRDVLTSEVRVRLDQLLEEGKA